MKNIFISIKMLVVVLLLASCSDNFLDVNTDPNNPTEVGPELLLPVATNYSAFTQERNRGQNTLGNMLMYNWSQSDGFSWYNDEFLYLVTPSFYQQIFDYTYGNALKQYQAIATVEGDEYGYYRAIGEIMKAYHFQILVDTYGDIPYFEALQRGSNPTPAYDDALIIYEDLIVKLSAANALIISTMANTEITAVLPGEDDTIMGGDMEDWIMFANTIKLRILTRQLSMSGRGGYLTTEFAKINPSNIMLSNIDVQLGYNNAEDQQNPKWAAFGANVAGTPTLNNNATCATPFVLNLLMTMSDPRIDFIYEKPATGHLGVIQGEQNYDVPMVDQFLPEFVSNIGPGIMKGPDMAAVLMSSAETHFNLAEATMAGYIGGSAQAHYEMGIQASFDYLGVGDATAYYNQSKNLVDWTASPNKLEAIITQKWIALNGIDAMQSWFDYNRTGYPSNLPVSILASTPDRPVRLSYPSSELTSNNVNLPSQPDEFNTKIFWGQ